MKLCFSVCQHSNVLKWKPLTRTCVILMTPSCSTISCPQYFFPFYLSQGLRREGIKFLLLFTVSLFMSRNPLSHGHFKTLALYFYAN